MCKISKKCSLAVKSAIFAGSRTNGAIVGSVFNDTRKVKVLSLPETIKKIDVSSEGPSSGVSSQLLPLLYKSQTFSVAIWIKERKHKINMLVYSPFYDSAYSHL